MFFAAAAGGGVRTTLNAIEVLNSNSGATCYAGFQLDADGKLYLTNNAGALVYQYDVFAPLSAAANYEARLTTSTGTLTTGTAGSWLALTLDRYWDVQRASAGTKSYTGTIEIRDATTLVVVESESVSLEAEYLL